jgi:hypothetical protein
VKIKEITTEGYVSSLAKGLLPDALQKVIDTPYKQKPELTNLEIAKQLHKQHGYNPETAQLNKHLTPNLGYLTWLNPTDFYHNKKILEKDLATLSPKKRAAVLAALGLTPAAPTP